MNAIRIIKEIDSNVIHIDGLDKFKGKKAEIIILIEDSNLDNREINREKAFKIINEYKGEIETWNREELYDS